MKTKLYGSVLLAVLLLMPMALAADQTITMGPYRWILTEADGYAITDWRIDTDGDLSWSDETDLLGNGIYLYLRGQNVSTLANTTAAGANNTDYEIYDNRSLRVKLATQNQTQIENIYVHLYRSGDVNADFGLYLYDSGYSTLLESATIANTSVGTLEDWHKVTFYYAVDKDTTYVLAMRTTDATGNAGAEGSSFQVSIDAALSATGASETTPNWQNTSQAWSDADGDACVNFEMDRHDEYTQLGDSTPASGTMLYQDDDVAKFRAVFSLYNSSGVSWSQDSDCNVTYWFYRDGRVKATYAGRIDDPGSLTTEVEEIMLKIDVVNSMASARNSTTELTSDGTDDEVLMPATDYLIVFDTSLPAFGLGWLEDQNFTDRATGGYGLTLAEPNVTLTDDSTNQYTHIQVEWADESSPVNLTADVQFEEDFVFFAATQQSYTTVEKYLQLGLAEYTSNGNSLVNATTESTLATQIMRWDVPPDQNQVIVEILGETGTHRFVWTFPAAKEVVSVSAQYADGTFAQLAENSAYSSGTIGFCDATAGTGEIYVKTTSNTGKTYVFIDYKPESSTSHRQGQAGTWGTVVSTSTAAFTNAKWVGVGAVGVVFLVVAVVFLRKTGKKVI